MDMPQITLDNKADWLSFGTKIRDEVLLLSVVKPALLCEFILLFYVEATPLWSVGFDWIQYVHGSNVNGQNATTHDKNKSLQNWMEVYCATH